MSSNGQFEKLLSPTQIGKLRLKNRIVKSPQASYLPGRDCFVNDKLKAFYEALARGGVGMVVLGHVYPIPPSPGEQPIGIWDDKFIPGLSELAEVMHKYDCPVFAQINHSGPTEEHDLEGGPPWCASSWNEDELPSPRPVLRPTRGISIAEIQHLQEWFVKAAERAQKAGIDGVEVHAAHTYMLCSFVSRIWNKRDDEYGCQNLENRTRIVVETIQKIKQHLGQDYPVGVRFNGEEWGSERGITSEESQGIAQILEKAGADYISITGYGHGFPPFRYVPDYWLYPEPAEYMKPFVKRFKKTGLLIPAAAAIKKVVSVPVLGVGRLTPELAERLLREDKIDLAVFGRALFADTELPNKVAAGRLEDIAPCTHCNTCEAPLGTPLRCRINAALGTVDGYLLKSAKRKKRVMVVGGGPAGMETARVAALRGHEVSLYEREPKLGGLLPLSAMVKGLESEDLPTMTRYLKTQVSKLGVKVNLGKEVTPELVDEVKPDVVVLATGGASTIPKIPGIDGRNVITSAELHRRVKLPLRIFGPKFLRWLTKFYLPVGKRVVVIGGLLEGCETAEFLVKRGRKVTITETSDQLGEGIPPRYLERLVHWLNNKRVATLTGVKYKRITDKGLTLITKQGKEQTIEADAVMVAIPQKPNTDLFKALKGKAPEVHLIGPSDGNQSWLIVDAVADGYRIGCAI